MSDRLKILIVVWGTLAASTVLLLPKCAGEDWAALKGRFVVEGEVAKPVRLDITRDAEVCGVHGLVDESLIVNPKYQGLKNVVIWLSSKKPVPVHPSLAAPPKPVQLDNRDCTFQPRIVRLRTGQILQSTNTDPVAHNVAVYARRNQPFSIVIPEDKPLERSFAREELLPIRVDCSIHAWMRAYLIITEHPYSAVTDADGNFNIPKVPEGKWEFRTWHERPGYIKSVEIAGKSTELKRGTIEVDVATVDIDLGQLTVNVDQFVAE